MNLEYIKRNISKCQDDSIVKFICDILGIDNSIEDYNAEKTYTKGDKVYIYSDGKHYVYKCLVQQSTPGPINITDEWSDLFS